MFEIVCGRDFEFSNITGIFTCGFYCQIGEQTFPDAQWTDFALHVLEWWIDELLRISGQKNAHFQLLFEDGPYWIEGVKKGQCIELSFMTSKKNASCPASIVIDYEALQKEIIKAARRLRTALFLAGHKDSAADAGLLLDKICQPH